MSRSEDGFTLAEVLVTVVITGIIAGAVTGSIIIGLRTTDATANRLTDSRDAQLVAAYFATDVQSADRVNPVNPPGPPPLTCAGPNETRVIDLVDDPLGGGEASVVSYFTESTSPGRIDLRRVACKGTKIVSDLVVASGLANPGAVMSCPGDVSCEPTQVKMTVSVTGCSKLTVSCRPGIDSQPYEYELLGTRRALT
jgi:prepilin-type N-terminal cleavage/methylation domain-containing protein